MAAILDFTHIAMSKVIFDHTTRSGILENPIVGHKNHEAAPILSKIVSILKFDLGKMAAILENVRFLRFAVN